MADNNLTLRSLKSLFSVNEEGIVAGYVYDPVVLADRLIVEVFADGLAVGLVRSNFYVDELQRNGVGDGCYGFKVPLPQSVLLHSELLEARIANTGEPVGSPIVPSRDLAVSVPADSGEVTWLGGLRLAGTLPTKRGFGINIRAIIDGQPVTQAMATRWKSLDWGGVFMLRPAFDLHLPAEWADGRVHHVDVVASDGTPIQGSPCFVIAFLDGLAAFIEGHAELESQRLRAEMADRLLPQSLPFATLKAWLDRFSPKTGQCSQEWVAVVLVGEGDADRTIGSLGPEQGCGAVIGCLAAAGRAGSFFVEDLCYFLDHEAADAEFVVFAPCGTRFLPSALATFANAMLNILSASIGYCDLCFGEDPSEVPIGFSAFDYQRCLEQGYCGSVFIMYREAALSSARSGADSLLKLLFSQVGRRAQSGGEPLHIPSILARVPILPVADLQTGLKEAVEQHLGNYAKGVGVSIRAGKSIAAVRIHHPYRAELVSIVIVTRNQAQRLLSLIEVIDASCHHLPVELVVVDGDSSDTTARNVLERLGERGIKCVRLAGALNKARLRNRGAALATGKYLLFLDDSLQPRADGWLEELSGRISDDDAGAVGPLIQWPSGIIRSAGLVLGPGLATAPAFGDHLMEDSGYAGLLDVAHEVSALPAASLMTKRGLFESLGGFDDVNFSLNHSDVDYCLRLRAKSYRIIVTPDAQMTDHSSGQNPTPHQPDLAARAKRELVNLQNRWGDIIMADPYYSPWLNLDGSPFSALAWPPRDCGARQNVLQRGPKNSLLRAEGS